MPHVSRWLFAKSKGNGARAGGCFLTKLAMSPPRLKAFALSCAYAIAHAVEPGVSLVLPKRGETAQIRLGKTVWICSDKTVPPCRARAETGVNAHEVVRTGT